MILDSELLSNNIKKNDTLPKKNFTIIKLNHSE